MDYSLLQSLPLFQSMDTDRIRRIILLSGCFEKDYKKGNYIYFEQELIENMGLILKGHVYMTKENVWGEKTILVRMGKGELFGENFACSHSPTASVTFYAPEPATLIRSCQCPADSSPDHRCIHFPVPSGNFAICADPYCNAWCCWKEQ